jgi:hypothetical protein
LPCFQAAGDVNRKANFMTEAELVAKEEVELVPWDYQGAIRTKYATRTSTNELEFKS